MWTPLDTRYFAHLFLKVVVVDFVLGVVAVAVVVVVVVAVPAVVVMIAVVIVGVVARLS